MRSFFWSVCWLVGRPVRSYVKNVGGNSKIRYTLYFIRMKFTRRIRDALKIKKKTDLRTLSQKGGGGPDPKYIACEIGTLGRGSTQKLICPNFESDLRTKVDLLRVVPLQAQRILGARKYSLSKNRLMGASKLKKARF